MHIVSTETQLCDKCGKPMGNARVANSQGTFHAECAGFSPFARIAELEAALTEVHGAHHECIDKLGMANSRIAELEELLREIDAKIIWESAVRDGTGQELEARVERALGISVNT